MSPPGVLIPLRTWRLPGSVTELFRDWKSPVADMAREIIKAYLAEAQKIAVS